jgi:hypothetical protein
LGDRSSSTTGVDQTATQRVGLFVALLAEPGAQPGRATHASSRLITAALEQQVSAKVVGFEDPAV